MEDFPGMEAVLASVIAVAGTLLGSIITYLFQRFSTVRTERFAREERLRQERLASYSAFVGAMTELRRGVISLWFARHRGDIQSSDLNIAFIESDRFGAAADHARFRVQLIADDQELVALADAAFEPIGAIRDAADRANLAEHEKRSQELLKAFIAAAAARLR